MPDTYQKRLTYKMAEVLGLYGQNGSGKTAIIDTLYYLQKIMTGNTLDAEIADYIDTASNQAEILADFNVFIETIIYEVSYRITLEKSGDGVNIVRETLSCAIHKDNSRSSKTAFIDYQRSKQESVFTP